MFSGDFFKEQIIFDESDLSAFEAYNNKLDECGDATVAFKETMGDATPAAQKYVKNIGNAKVEMDALPKATKAASVGMKALSVAMNMALSIGIAMAIGAIVKEFQALANAQEDAIAKADEFINKFNEQRTSLTENKESIDSMSEDYERLANGVDSLGRNVSLNADEYARYNEIVNKIADMFPQMVQGYTDEGNAIIAHKGNVEELTKAYEDQKKAAQDAIIIGSADVFKGFKAKLDNSADMPWEETGLLQQLDIVEKVVNGYASGLSNHDINDSINGTFQDLKSVFEGAGIDIGFTTISASDLLDEYLTESNVSKLNAYFSTLRTTIASETSKIKPIMQAYLEQSFEYQGLDEDVQDIVKQIVGQFDSEFYAQFNNETEMASWVTENIVNKFKGKDGEKMSTEFQMMLGIQTQFNKGEITVSEYQEKLAAFLKTIEPLPDETEKYIKLLFGITTNEDGTTSSDIDTMVANVEKKFNGKFKDEIGQLNLGDLEILANMDISPEGIDDWSDVAALIADARKESDDMTASLESLHKALDNIQSAYETVKSAIAEYNEQGYLSVDAFQALMELEPQYLQYLMDEEGNLNLANSALNDYTASLIDNMAMKQMEKIVDYVAGLTEEERQLYLTKNATDDASTSLIDFAAATIQAKFAAGELSEDELESLKKMMGNVVAWAESAKAGIGQGGLGKSDKSAKDNEKKLEDLKKQRLKKDKEYAEKVADIQEDLAEKEKDFAEKMADAWKEEHLEQLKDDLEKRADIINRYKKDIEIDDFGLDFIDKDDFLNKSDLLTSKLSNLTSYGKALREEFDRVANIIPQTGSEAQELANRMEELGSEMRSNMSAIRETTVELQKLSIDMAASLMDVHFGSLEGEIDNVDRRIQILRSSYKDDYKNSSDILNMELLLPVVSDYDKQRREKQRGDQALIDVTQETQDEINEIITKALEMQSKENAEAREKERQKLIEDMEKARKDAEKKLAEAHEDYLEFLEDNKLATNEAVKEMEKTFGGMELKIPEVDISSVEAAAKKIGEILGNAFAGSYSVNANVGPVGGSGNTSASAIGGAVVPGYTRVSSTYGYRIHPVYKTKKFHSGTDLAAPKGTPIYAYSQGTVVSAGWNGGYGNCVIIDHGNGQQTLYAHASKLNVTSGQTVTRGQKIAEVGTTGTSTGNHLHFEYRVNGKSADPSGIFAAHASGTPAGNAQAKRLGIAGENYKPEILIDKTTGEKTYIDSPTVIDTTKTDVVGEKQTAKLPKFATGNVIVIPDGLGDLYTYMGWQMITAKGTDQYKLKTSSGMNFDSEGYGKINGRYVIATTTTMGNVGDYLDIELADGTILGAVVGDIKNPSDAGWTKYGHMNGRNVVEFVVDKSSWYGQKDNPKLPKTVKVTNLGENYFNNPDFVGTASSVGISSDSDDKVKVEVTYDPEVDYMEKMLNATTKEDVIAANQSRNKKIREEGLDTTTYSDDEIFKMWKNGTLAEELRGKEIDGLINDIDSFYLEAVNDIGRVVMDYRDDILAIENNDDLDDFEKSQAMYDVLYKRGQDVAAVGNEAYEYINSMFEAWIKGVEEGTEEWSLEVFNAYTDTLADLKDYIFEREDEAVKYKQAAADDRWSISDNWISERNFYKDWGIFGDSEVKAWERVVKWLKDEYPNELEKIKNAEHNLFEARKQEILDVIEFSSTKINSIQTITGAYHNTTNSIVEEQHNLNKELKASMTMYEYLDEETRKLLFNQEDYNKLMRELNGIQGEADDLLDDFNDALRGATKENIEEITAEYEMQYEMLMKSYEIKKAELEVLKKQQQLNNVLNERNVRMLINGKWEWVANTQDVIDAQNELEDAKFEAQQARISKSQEATMNELETAQNALTTTINNIESGVVEFRENIGDITKSLADIDTYTIPALDSVILKVISAMNRFDDGNEALISSAKTQAAYGKNSSRSYVEYNGNGTTSYVVGKNYNSSTNYMGLMQQARSESDIVALNGKRNAKIVGEGMNETLLSDEEAVRRWKNGTLGKYASGAKKTDEGLALINEILPEGIITKHGTLIPMANFGGGEMVFNHKMMENLWQQAQIPWSAYKATIPEFATSRSSTVDQSITINKVEVYEPTDFDGFISDLTKRAKSYSAVTKKM